MVHERFKQALDDIDSKLSNLKEESRKLELQSKGLDNEIQILENEKKEIKDFLGLKTVTEPIAMPEPTVIKPKRIKEDSAIDAVIMDAPEVGFDFSKQTSHTIKPLTKKQLEELQVETPNTKPEQEYYRPTSEPGENPNLKPKVYKSKYHSLKKAEDLVPPKPSVYDLQKPMDEPKQKDKLKAFLPWIIIIILAFLAYYYFFT